LKQGGYCANHVLRPERGKSEISPKTAIVMGFIGKYINGLFK
jgi:hypothetical protein